MAAVFVEAVVRWLALALLLGVLAPGTAVAQRSAPPVIHCATPRTPAEATYCERSRAYDTARPKLQAQAKVLMTGAERDTAHDCPDAQNTYDFNLCFGSALHTAEANLASLEDIIRKLEDIPQSPGFPAPGPPGLAGAVLTPGQTLRAFEDVERSWHKYRDLACQAAFNEMDGGTGAPSFQLECSIRLTRDHMRELNMIYGEELRL